MKKLFVIFDNHETSVDLVATSEVSVSMTINDTKNLVELKKALETLGTVRVEPEMAILSLVGQNLWKDGTFLVRVFEALREVPIHLVSMGSSEINLSLVLKAVDLDLAVEKTHNTFFDKS